MFPLLRRLDNRDRTLYLRWVIGDSASRAAVYCWTFLTFIGGITASVAVTLVPLLVAQRRLGVSAVQAAVSLVVSLLVVQSIKRLVVRTRPAERVQCHAHVQVPDRFSFPSGHAASSMSVAFIYASTFPRFAWPLLVLAALVGVSRVRLGAHYPGDVVAGQLIAVATGVAVRALW